MTQNCVKKRIAVSKCFSFVIESSAVKASAKLHHKNSKKKLAGIYLHIPFCKQACAYCNFHFSTSLRYKPEMIEALVSEIALEKDYLKNEIIDTIYLGGGTPSILTGEECNLFIQTIRHHFMVAANAEITLEANPDDITKPQLQYWKVAGINRLSIGVQSFIKEELKWMNRAHNAKQAFSSLELVRQEFENFTIDLIYGSPLLTDEMWERNVDTAMSLAIPHVSCYALTVEEKTPLYKSIALKKTVDVDNEKQARQFLLLIQWLQQNGYEHYEVSNFAKPGYRSRHNSSYWKGTHYLGIGPSAHSYNGTERRWNVANNAAYIRTLQLGVPQRETETLSAVNRLNENIMISLRTSEGLDLRQVESTWGITEKERIEQQLKKFANKGLIRFHNDSARLTNEGMLMADGIAADLFI